jgi:hypothetical protein
MGKSTLSPPKIAITCIICLQLIVLVMYGHHILDYFCLFKVYLISFRFHLISYFENSKNIEKFERLEYTHDKIILVTKFGNFNIYFKTKVTNGIFG